MIQNMQAREYIVTCIPDGLRRRAHWETAGALPFPFTHVQTNAEPLMLLYILGGRIYCLSSAVLAY